MTASYNGELSISNVKTNTGKYSELGANGQGGGRVPSKKNGPELLKGRWNKKGFRKDGRSFFRWYLYITAMVLKVEGTSESSRGLVKTQLLTPFPEFLMFNLGKVRGFAFLINFQ